MSVLPQSTSSVVREPQQPVVSGVAGVIQRAAQATGASFEYLLATAKVESNFNPDLKARGSSATGLFQFIEQTWLGMIKNAGSALGFGNYADAISRNASGRYQVSDPQLRDEILQLRRSPAASAAVAGAFTQQNATTLTQRIGRRPTDGELYMAHFFGTGGAGQLINAVKDRPQVTAATMFPAAARANRSIFYDRQGGARSVAGVYSELNRRYQVARTNALPRIMPRAVATAEPAAAQTPDTDGTTRAFAAVAERPVVASAGPIFRSLFQTGEGGSGEPRRGVAPIVSSLWGNPAAALAESTPSVAAAPTATEQAAAPAGAIEASEPLDLFRELRTDVRRLFTGS